MPVRAATALDGPQQAVKDLGRQVAGSFHVAYLPIDIAVDGLVAFVVDGSQPVPVKGRCWPPTCFSMIAQTISPALYKTYEERNRYGLVPLNYTRQI